jgi:hypothetical protein
MSHATACIDIDHQVMKIKRNVFTKKNLLSSLFENKMIISTPKSITINHWLAKQVITMEHPVANGDKYVYWVAGGLSWNKWYDKNSDEKVYTDEEIISMRTCNYDIRYIYYNDKDNLLVKDKIIFIYNNIILVLQQILLAIGINTTIKTTNFNYDGTMFEDTNAYPNKKTYNITLVLNELPENQGGAKKPHRKNHMERVRAARKLANLVANVSRQNPKLEKTLYDIYRSELLNKTIVEFNFQAIQQSMTQTDASVSGRPNFSIKLFKETYLKITDVGYTDIDDHKTIEEKLNKLNGLGLITYSYLNTCNKEQNLGLNVDIYRQTLFFEKELKNNYSEIAEYFKRSLLDNYYNVFSRTNFFNVFFVQNINKIYYKYSAINDTYAIFIDYIERWLMSIFRPAINSFIREINEELMPLGVVLFIAGGDAMRRYDFNISSTKDIDTKLYIGHKKQEYIAKNDMPGYEEFKKNIKLIIVKHIVKLRNYLETHFRNLFTIRTLETHEHGNEIKELDYSNIPLEFVNPDTEQTFKLFFTLDNDNIQHFRTREIRPSDNFPVNLFSIDYESNIVIEYKVNTTGEIRTKEMKYTISLLDVVLQEDDYNDTYYTMKENDIPVASLSFLKDDLNITYTTEDRAVARITSGKYIKDIERYKKLCYITYFPQPPEEPLTTEQFNIISEKIESLYANGNKDIETKFNIIIYKLQNKLEFNIFDVIICIQLVRTSGLSLLLKKATDLSELDKRYLNILKKLIANIANFQVNIYNEKLNKNIGSNYTNYRDDKDNIININYRELFTKLVEADDGKLKHMITYNNTGIRRLFTEYGIVRRTTQSAAKSTTAKAVPAIKKSTSRAVPSVPVAKATPAIKKSTSRAVPSAPAPVAKATPVFVPPSATSRTTRRGTVFGNP